MSRILLTLLFFLILPLTHRVFADGITVNPAFTEVTLDTPKQSKSVDVKFTNNSKDHVSLDISAVDFRQQGVDGSISFEGIDPNTYNYSLASFLTFSENSIELDPGATEVLTVYIDNRENLSPGGHYAAIIAKLSPNTEQIDIPQVRPSVSSLFLIRKEGGERFNLSITDRSWPSSLLAFSMPSRIKLTFQNAGNIHVIPYGRVEVKDLFGNLLSEGSINPASSIILPESRRIVEVVMTKVRPEPLMTIATVNYEGQDSLKKTKYTIKDSVILVNKNLVYALILIPIVILVWVYLRRRRSV